MALVNQAWSLAIGTPFAITLLFAATWYLERQRSQSHKTSEEPSAPESELNIDSMSFDKLTAWLLDDTPITTPQQDAFGHHVVAKRIARRLIDSDSDQAPTIALVGRPGAGKSSIRNLVQHYVKNHGQTERTIAFVPVSLWPFDTPEAAIRGILGALTREVGRHVNCLSLAGVSTDYIQAIESSGTAWGFLARFLQGPSDPKHILQGIESIAVAINVRFILWIEDVERFAASGPLNGQPDASQESERLGRIRALLHLLDECRQISVVIADATLRTSTFDVAKIARYIEEPPNLPVEAVWNVISTLRKEWHQHGGLIDPAMPDERKRLDIPATSANEFVLTYRHDPDQPTLHEAISILLMTPRTLKSALRLTHEAWRYQSGEIDLDDVLAISVIRESYPDIFALIDSEIDAFRTGLGPLETTSTEGHVSKFHPALSRFDRLLDSETDKVRRSAVELIIDAVFPDMLSQRSEYPHSAVKSLSENRPVAESRNT